MANCHTSTSWIIRAHCGCMRKWNVPPLHEPLQPCWQECMDGSELKFQGFWVFTKQGKHGTSTFTGAEMDRCHLLPWKPQFSRLSNVPLDIGFWDMWILVCISWWSDISCLDTRTTAQISSLKIQAGTCLHLFFDTKSRHKPPCIFYHKNTLLHIKAHAFIHMCLNSCIFSSKELSSLQEFNCLSA